MPHAAPLFAFGFTEFSLLGWLAVAAAPWLLHFLQRKQRQEVSWGAMMFLRAAAEKQSRYWHWEQWLLLLLRTALLIAIVTAAAGPSLRSPTANDEQRRAAHYIFVVDVSASMGVTQNERSRWEELVERISAFVKTRESGAGFSLLAMGPTPQIVIGDPTPDRELLLQQLQVLKLTDGKADLAALLRTLNQVLQTTRFTERRYAERQVILLTDLASNTWEPLGSSLCQGLARELEPRLGGGGVAVWELGEPLAKNLSVKSLQWTGGLPALGSDLDFQVVIRNHSAQPQNFSGTLTSQGQVLQRLQGEIPARGEQQFTLTQRAPKAGIWPVEFSLAADDFVADNTRYAAVRIVDPVRCLIVYGGSDPREVDPLRFALDPEQGRLGRERTDLQLKIVSATEWPREALSDYQVVWFHDLAAFSSGEAGALQEYLDQGGAAVWFLGERAQPDAYRRQFAAGQQSLLPVELLEPANKGTYFLDPLNYAHPVVRLFGEQERSDLTRIPFTRYYRVRPLGDAKKNVALGFRDQADPALVSGSAESSGTMVFAFPVALPSETNVNAANAPWTVLPALPSFHPLIQESLQALLLQRLQRPSVTVGEPLHGAWQPQAWPRGQVDFERGADHAAPRQVALTNQPHPHRSSMQRWTMNETPRAGFYRVSEAGPAASAATPEKKDQPPAALGEMFAVNIEPSESEQQRWVNATWPEGWEHTKLEGEDLPELSQAAASSENRLPQWLLLAAVAMLFLELWLSGRTRRN
jgi:hypothetical protein